MKIERMQLVIISIIAFAAGILIAPLFFDTGFWPLIFIGVLLLIIFLFRKNQIVFVCALFTIFIILGTFYSHLFMRYFSKDESAKFNSQKVEILGFVNSTPDQKEAKQVLPFTIEKIKSRNSFSKSSGKILVYVSKYPTFEMGDYLKIKGVLQEPPVFPDFNYKNYLAANQIYSVIFPISLEKINQTPHFNFVQRAWFNLKIFLYNQKSVFENKINRIFPEPQASFLDGLLLGVKKNLSDDLLSKFNTTGTTHILVISGFNITILIKAFMVLTKRWSRRLAYLIALISVSLFVILTGAEAPVLRAALMAVILIWAESEGRRKNATMALLLAGLIMVLFKPTILRSDIGFQLSFLATLGLIHFSEVLENWLNRSRLKKIPKIISESGIATISAQIFVLPILLVNFGTLSLIAPFANILILPVIPAAMLFGFAAVVLGFIWVPLGQIIGSVCWLFLSYILFIVDKFSQIPGASFQIDKLSWLWVGIYYLILVIGLFWYYKKRLRQKR